jgi:hypothetical protein
MLTTHDQGLASYYPEYLKALRYVGLWVLASNAERS